jgi:hypothetical protein
LVVEVVLHQQVPTVMAVVAVDLLALALVQLLLTALVAVEL